MQMTSEFWSPRRYILEPIAELFEAAQLLDMAATAHIEGRTEAATQLIRQADKQEIFDWSETLWGPKKQSIHRYRIDPEKPPLALEEKRAPGRISSAVEQEVIARDGYICRFCGIPVIHQKAQSVLRKAYPDALRWGSKNTDKHAAFQAMDLDIDHIVPRSLGGQNVSDNLVVTCAPCNCARGNHTLAEMGLVDPRLRRPEKRPKDRPEDWDGLTRLVNGRIRPRPEQPEPKDGSHPKSLRPQAGSKIKQEGTGKMTRDEFCAELGPNYVTCFEELEIGLKSLDVVLEYTSTTAILKWCVPGHDNKINVGKIQVRRKYAGEIWIDHGTIPGQAADKLGLREIAAAYEAGMEETFKDYRHEGDGKRYRIQAVCHTTAWLEAIDDFIQTATAKLQGV